MSGYTVCISIRNKKPNDLMCSETGAALQLCVVDLERNEFSVSSKCWHDGHQCNGPEVTHHFSDSKAAKTFLLLHYDGVHQHSYMILSQNHKPLLPLETEDNTLACIVDSNPTQLMRMLGPYGPIMCFSSLAMLCGDAVLACRQVLYAPSDSAIKMLLYLK